MADATRGISDLVTRLRNDGVAAGNDEKNRILEDAKRQAEGILAQAKVDAQKVRDDANKAAKEKEEQLKGELSRAARDFSTGFADRIKKHAIEPVVRDEVRGVLTEDKFLETCLVELCSRYVDSGGQALEVVVSDEMKKKLDGFFAGKLKDAMKGGKLDVSTAPGMAGFALKRDGESFVWDFSVDAVARSLADLVDPSLRSFFDWSRPNATGTSASNGRGAASAA